MSLDDRRLIAQCLRGRTEAFGELVRRYQDRLYNTIYRLVGNAEDALDVTQEAFLAAYQNLGRFKGESQFFTWLYRIAVNTAITHRRKRKAVVSLSRESGAAGPPEPADPAKDADPAYGLEQEDRDRLLQQALDRLSLEHRTVLVLKEVDELDYESIAAIVGVPVGTVRSRLHRARLELRRILEAKGLLD